MDEAEERQFIESLTLRVWKARTEGGIIGAAFVLGIGFLLYLVAYAGPLNPMSVFYEFGLFTIFADPIRDFCRLPAMPFRSRFRGPQPSAF